MKTNMLIRNTARFANNFVASKNKLSFILSKLLLLLNANLYFVRVRLIDGVKIYLHASRMSIHNLIVKNYYREEMIFFRYFLKSGDVFVDVGANIGVLSLMAARAVAPTGCVYSFEPNPRVFRFLVENFRLNSIKEGCQQYECALADEDTISSFYVRTYGDDLGSLSKSTHLAGRSVEVRMSRGDIVLKDVPHITLLKIDVEGAEFRVLKGFQGLMDRIKFILFEADSQMMQSHGLSFSQLFDFLEPRGFRILTFAEGLPTELHRDAVIQHADLYAVRPNDIEEFMARYSQARSKN
jgi:FkbM family methyltransferase